MGSDWPSDPRAERKVQQLCKEVARTVGYALPACRDPQLRGLVVLEVLPAPDGSRLEVLLYPTSPEALDVALLHERLSWARGFLRAEVARALQRKRTPELVYRILPPPDAVDPEAP
jgi:ribosome-binding factor A